MIDAEQWRCAIGVFYFSNRKPKCAKVKTTTTTTTQNKDYLSDLCGRLFVIAIALWTINLEYQCSNYFTTDTNPKCLMLSGDVESNPGPTIEEHFQQMQQQMQLSFQQLSKKNDINNQQLSAQLSKQSQRITEIHRHVMTIEHTVTDMKLNIAQMQTRIDTLEDEQKIQQLDGIHNSDAINSLGDRLDKVENEIEQKAREERKPNVIIHGVEEHLGDNDTRESITKHTVAFLNQHVPSKVWSDGDIKNCFRMGAREKNVGKRRPILVSLNQFTDKLTIMKAKEHLKTIKFGVTTDLTTFQRDELRRLKGQGKFGYYKQGKLVVTDDRHTSQQPDRVFRHAQRQINNVYENNR